MLNRYLTAVYRKLNCELCIRLHHKAHKHFTIELAAVYVSMLTE